MRSRMRASDGHPQGRLLLLRFAPWMNFRNAHPHDLMWPISMLYARSIAERAGWQVRLLDLHVEALDRHGIFAEVDGWKPDVVLMDSMTPTLQLAVDVASDVRASRPETRIWGIGQHASEQSEDLLFAGSPFDGVLLGEYEVSIKRLLDNGATRLVDGSAALSDDGERVIVQGTRGQVSDLDSLPPLDPRGLRLDAYGMRSTHVPRFGQVRWGYLLTSRGCPFLCTFCSPTLRQSYGRGFRGQSAEKVVDDMERLHLDHGVDAIYMIDDIFSLDHERVAAICEEMIRREVEVDWVIQTRPDMINPEMVALLARARCRAVKMGVESGVDRILKLVKKGVRRDRILEAARDIRAGGLFLTAYYMLGHPTETLEEMEETVRFAHKVAADMIQVAFHTPYPGSQSYRDYREEVQDLSELNHYETHHVNPSLVDGETLERFQRQFYLRYYLSGPQLWSYLRRRALYRATDPIEWQLAIRAMRYLLGQRGQNGATAVAARWFGRKRDPGIREAA